MLEVGCGCGATLAHIAYEWPDAKVSGIEIQDDIAKIGANYLDIRQGNIETIQISYEKRYVLTISYWRMCWSTCMIRSGFCRKYCLI